MNQKADAFHIDDESKPYTHLNFKNDPDEFQFAIVTDNAGGARAGVFPKAVEMVNLLQPEFVVNAGDLIEGYSEDEEQIRAWWQEVERIPGSTRHAVFLHAGKSRPLLRNIPQGLA